jgi:ATP-dependent DNA ligase
MVDALVSGTSDLTVVEVRVFSRAPYQEVAFDFFCFLPHFCPTAPVAALGQKWAIFSPPPRPRSGLPRYITPSAPTLRPTAPSGAEWLHEIKYDGYRVQGHERGGTARIFTPNVIRRRWPLARVWRRPQTAPSS